MLIGGSFSVAHACSVCGVAKEQSEWAFILTTAILTFVPLIFIFTVVMYFKRHWEKADHNDEQTV